MDRKERVEARRRAIAHIKSALRYERQGARRKAKAHFGRAVAYCRTGFGTGATAGGKAGILDLPPDIIEGLVRDVIEEGEGEKLVYVEAILEAVKLKAPVIVSDFLRMPPADRHKSPFYPVYIMTAHATARMPASYLLKFLAKYEDSVTRGGSTSRTMASAVRDIIVIIISQWYHMCPYRFHELVDLLYSPKTPQAIKDICKRVLDDFLAHLDGTECTECRILQRDETKTQIHRIIEDKQDRLKPDAVESEARSLLLEYENEPVTTKKKYGHLCVWKTGALEDMISVFSNRTWKEEWDVRLWDTRKVTSMKSTFYKCLGLLRGVEHWSVIGVTDMSWMFSEASSFNGDIGQWNTRSVVNMNGMFYQASSFNQDIGKWDTSNVTDMSYMFSNSRSFNRDIGNWKTSKVTNMSSMFAHASSFNKDIGKWDTRNVVNMRSMFYKASSFNHDLTRWDMSKVTNKSLMFYDATAMNDNEKKKPAAARIAAA